MQVSDAFVHVAGFCKEAAEGQIGFEIIRIELSCFSQLHKGFFILAHLAEDASESHVTSRVVWTDSLKLLVLLRGSVLVSGYFQHCAEKKSRFWIFWTQADRPKKGRTGAGGIAAPLPGPAEIKFGVEGIWTEPCSPAKLAVGP